MKIFATKRAASARIAFQLSPVAAGCAVFLSVLAGSAYAQTTEQDTTTSATSSVATAPASAQQAAAAAEPTPPGATPGVATVQVTGIRRGIEAAISIKKNSSSIVEAISAEDIGKLPDQSVAESISRLPGVSAQRGRSSGKASDISVRGLSPSFNGTLLNGREMASTGNARSPEFDLFPAELMGSIVIYKTPDASVVGQGLASTIDLRTVQPLDFGKRTVAVSVKKSRLGVKQRDGLPEGDGDRYTLSYVDQFANRTIGVAVGFTRYEEMGGGQSKFNSWGTADMTYNGATVKVPNGFGYDTEQNSHNRDGAFASLQFRPNKNFKSTVDVFYSAGETGLKKTGFEAGVAGNAGGAYELPHVLTSAVVSNGVATSGTIGNWKGVVRNHYEGAEDDLKTIGWNSELKFGEWTSSADLTWSKATKLGSRYETTAGTLPSQQDTLAFSGFNGANVTEVKYTPGINYADRGAVKLTDTMGWSGGAASPQAGYLGQPYVEDEVKAIRLNAKKAVEWGPVVATTFGYNFTARDKQRTGQDGRLMVIGGSPTGAANVPGSETAPAGASGFNVVSWDPRGSLGTVYEIAEKVDADILNKWWDVKERISTVYAMGDLEGEMFGLPYRGNAGVQAIHTDQMGGGYQVDSGRCTGNTPTACPGMRVAAGDKYWDVLPSLNLSFDLKNEQKVRLGLAKVVSRANLDDLRAGQNVTLSNQQGVSVLTSSGGNPQLKPFRAKAFDLSYEKYFGNKGYVSAALFYKKLDTYIFRMARDYDFASTISPETTLPPGGSTIGRFTQPMNGDGGNLRGYELAINLPFSMASQYLDGFGVMLNHSDTKSSIDLPREGFGNVTGSAVSIPLPGLSRKVSNLRLYYEKNGFQIAAAARKRSSFLGQVSDFQDNAQLTFIKGETIVDLQASYEIQSGWLKGVSLFAQAQNWNNQPFLEFTDDENNPTNRVDYGRTYHFGASYKF
ncbi:TonB-dependent receptor [Massilia yuzhufengensis]|uniref:Iron complex outermembrane recepter protein n=1 Tax=Massilia yuzhufengensis TaxID=1164594 RepID=A0A1I1I9W1_9BURK|nr:TonB-dependent receptor [Massilia yuzhufengensis]SFC33036.1 iron complex outermembrane recepter protein [Massilia yuzhufengensis]